MARTTHTYAILELSGPAFAEIRTKLAAAGCADAIHWDDNREVVDMHGLAVAMDPAPRPPVDIELASILSQATKEGKVELKVNGETVQMSLELATERAHQALDAFDSGLGAGTPIDKRVDELLVRHREVESERDDARKNMIQLAMDLNRAFGSAAIDAMEFPAIVTRLRERAHEAEAAEAALARVREALEGVLRYHSIDCGVHYCRYCLAKSPEWNHIENCPYALSVRAFEIARAALTPAAPEPPR